MPNLSSSKKALRQNRKRRVLNLRRLRMMRQVVKDFKKLIKQGKNEEAKNLIPSLYRAIDKTAKRKIIKKNTAARKKSRLMKSLLSNS